MPRRTYPESVENYEDWTTATASIGGASSTSYGERPDATTIRLFTDHLFDGPDGRNSGADFVKFGGSSTSSVAEVLAGGQGVTGVYVNGNNDRGTYWGPELYPSGDEASSSAFLWECRCMYPSTWTAGHVNFGVYGTDNVVDYNDQPPGIGYTTSIYAGVAINQSQTYWQKVKHESLSGGNATQSNLTARVLVYDDTWVRLGVSGSWDTGNSRWDLRYFLDGSEIGTDTLTVVGGLGVGYIGCGVGTYSSPGWRMYVDWISLQYTRAANVTLLDIDDLP